MVIMRELSEDNIEIEYTKVKDDKALASARFFTDLDQFEVIYSTLYHRMETDMKDCVSSMGFRIKEHDIIIHTMYLTKEQIEYLISNVLALMNGVIQAQNFKIRMVEGLRELNKQVLIMGD